MEQNQIKLTEEELKSINDLRESIRLNIETVGNLSIRKRFIERDLERLNSELTAELYRTEELNEKEKELISSVISKYGEGHLDFETGIYTKA